jgi:hypothetical protein
MPSNVSDLRGDRAKAKPKGDAVGISDFREGSGSKIKGETPSSISVGPCRKETQGQKKAMANATSRLQRTSKRQKATAIATMLSFNHLRIQRLTTFRGYSVFHSGVFQSTPGSGSCDHGRQYFPFRQTTPLSFEPDDPLSTRQRS